MSVVIGILALQGDVEAHRKVLHRIGAHAALVRDADELARVDGLIIPGGESTTIGKLIDRVGLAQPLRRVAAQGMPIYGTCAGMILLARDIVDSDQPRLGVMDIAVARNAFGRQVDSFEADIEMPAVGDPAVRGVFIRAPYVARTGDSVEVLATYQGVIVGVRQGYLLATAFHPELTDDTRVHRAFVGWCADRERQ